MSVCGYKSIRRLRLLMSLLFTIHHQLLVYSFRLIITTSHVVPFNMHTRTHTHTHERDDEDDATTNESGLVGPRLV